MSVGEVRWVYITRMNEHDDKIKVFFVSIGMFFFPSSSHRYM